MDRRTAVMGLISVIATPPQLTRDKGVLTVNLDQWTLIRVVCEGRAIEIPPKVLFDELAREEPS